MSTIQNTIQTRPTLRNRRGPARLAAAALAAIAVTVLIIALTSTSRTVNPTAQRSPQISAPASPTQPHAVINPETGLMHGGYVTPQVSTSPQGNQNARPHSVLNPETGLMHGA